jgi:hypothetical protein
VRKPDLTSGSGDNSFGQGTKEDTAVPSVVDGSIRPNKSDLLTVGVVLERPPAGGRFLHVYWHRVQEPQGTTNMDFEFNQSSTLSGNGVTPVRTSGDILIQYDLAQGGTNPQCVAFGSAYLKSRSSDSFTAALKDFIAPEAVNISQCGSIRVLKVDDATPANALNGAVVNLLTDNAPVGGSPGAEDVLVDSCTTGPPDFPDGACSFLGILQGSYWVVEITAPPGHDLPSPAFQSVTVVADELVTVTFVNPRQRGAIVITKTRKHAATPADPDPHPGVTFTVRDSAGNIVPGGTVVTDANGQACVDGLLFGTYSVTETVPAGYVPEGLTTKSVAVDNKADCGPLRSAAEQVAFANVPLTDLSVSVDSQVPGATSSTIDCGVGSAGPGEDISLSLTDLVPGTYTCTIVIDP